MSQGGGRSNRGRGAGGNWGRVAGRVDDSRGRIADI